MKPFVANTVHIFDVRDGADTRLGDLTKKVSVEAKDGFKNPAWYDGNAAYDQMAKVTENKTLTAKAVKVEENKDKIIPGKENENPPKGYIAISVVNDKTSVKTEVKRIYWIKNDESVRYNDIVLKVNADQATEAKDPAPEGQKITVDQGDTPNAEDGIKNKDELKNVKSYTFKNPVDTSHPGTIRALGVKVTRVDGADRYEVNRNSIVKYMPNSSKAVIASGMLYMDALSSVPYAHALKASIVLVNKDTVPPVIAKLLTTKMKDAVIVGGANTIAPKNKMNLEALMGKKIERIGGGVRTQLQALFGAKVEE